MDRSKADRMTLIFLEVEPPIVKSSLMQSSPT